jgi:hypothetical protein
MSATTDTEPTLFDPRPRDAEAAPQHAAAPSEPPAPEAEVQAEASAETDAKSEPAVEGDKPVQDRKRLAEQLDALKRKEAELRRALAVADHPELADAIRALEAGAYCVTRAETKLAQGFSKSEARRREVIEKKLGSLREKRTEIDTQIKAFEEELSGLGTQRIAEFEAERKSALKDLMITLATHDAALCSAGLDAQSLVPELAAYMPELEAVAREVSSAASN